MIERLVDGVAVTDIYTALQGYYGGMQLNDFTKFGKNYKVMLQADNQFRTDPSMNHLLTVRNAAGQMVPVDTYITPQKTTSAFVVTRYNNFPAVSIGGNTKQGVSSGDAIKALEEVAKNTLPQGYTYDWGGQTREEIKAGSQVLIIFGFGIVFVFLVLAALYESWKVPFVSIIICSNRYLWCCSWSMVIQYDWCHDEIYTFSLPWIFDFQNRLTYI